MRINGIPPGTMQLALGDYFLISFPSLDTWEKEDFYIEDQADNFEFTELDFTKIIK